MSIMGNKFKTDMSFLDFIGEAFLFGVFLARCRHFLLFAGQG